MVVKIQKQSPGEVLKKKTFLKFLQNLQEETCNGVSLFNKIAGYSHVTLTKRDSKTGAFLQILQSFKKNTFGLLLLKLAESNDENIVLPF